MNVMKTIWYILIFVLSSAFISSCAEEGKGYEPDPIVEPEPEPVEEDVKPNQNGVVVTSGAVDLGLSVKWAACDLGAEVCYERGNKYKWGDQRTDCLLDICGTSYDQATAELGKGWQLPSLEQAEELVEKCLWTKTSYRGYDGVVVTGPSGNAIFFRDAYIYTYWMSEEIWTGTCDVSSNEAYYFYYYSYQIAPRISTADRYSSKYIRPVYVGK